MEVKEVSVKIAAQIADAGEYAFEQHETWTLIRQNNYVNISIHLFIGYD